MLNMLNNRILYIYIYIFCWKNYLICFYLKKAFLFGGMGGMGGLGGMGGGATGF